MPGASSYRQQFGVAFMLYYICYTQQIFGFVTYLILTSQFGMVATGEGLRLIESKQ